MQPCARNSRRRSAPSAPIPSDDAKAGADRAALFDHRHLGHLRIRRTFGAKPQHLFDLGGRAREHRLDAAVARVAHRAVETKRAGGVIRPGAIIDALHASFDSDTHGSGVGLGHAHANSRITASTLRLSPGLASTLDTLPSRSAFSTFSIFIASTTQSASPALTSCPSLTASDTTMPGIGQSKSFEVSAFSFTSISAASSASRSVSTLTGTSTPS